MNMHDDSIAAILQVGDWRQIAHTFKQECCPTLIHSHGRFYQWDSERGCYVEILDMRARLRDFMAEASMYKDGKLTEFRPNTKAVSEGMNACADHFNLTLEMPCWSDDFADRPPASECIAFPNGILHVETGEWFEPTPEFYNLNAVGFAYDANTPSPVLWLATLAQYFAHDPDCILTLQEMFGYLLTADTSLQKIFGIFGPKRSGKSLIARLLRALVGSENCTASSLTSMGNEFGLMGFIGKMVALITEAIMGRDANVHTIVERLLSISGEDTVSVNQKNAKFWIGQLRTRILLTGNSLPRFKDDGGALAHRMIVLQMVKSFYGEEDTTLESRLKAELPGILLWSLEGLKRLRKQGKFTEPQSARDAKEDLADLASPERAFVGECCELGADKIVEKDALYRRFRAWCVASGQPYIAEKAVFSKNLLAAFTGQVRKGKLSTREGRVPSFHGLSVLPASDPSQTGVSEQEECPF